MTKDILIVDYDPFALESRVSTYKNGYHKQVNVYSSPEELANSLIALAYENNIYDIRVNGPLMIQSQLSKMVKEQEQKQYSVNKIRIGGL